MWPFRHSWVKVSWIFSSPVYSVSHAVQWRMSQAIFCKVYMEHGMFTKHLPYVFFFFLTLPAFFFFSVLTISIFGLRNFPAWPHLIHDHFPIVFPVIVLHYQHPFCELFYYFNQLLLLATRTSASNIASFIKVKAILVLKNLLARL